MKRNILKYAEQGHEKLKKNGAYSLSLSELKELTDYFSEQMRRWGSATSGAYEAITEAYAAGFEAGHRCAKKHK